MAGRFCALEGVDGSGKSGALAHIVDALTGEGIDLVATREPGGTEEGLAVRRLLLAGGALDWTPTAELLLVNAGRAQHVERVIRPAMARGALVLCDRYAGSTLAYQGAGRGLPVEEIFALHRLAAGDLWPDLTIVLDIDPKIALTRSRKRLAAAGVDENRFETLDLAFHQRVRQSFLDQAASRPDRHVVIDASRAATLVQANALGVVRALLVADEDSEAS